MPICGIMPHSVTPGLKLENAVEIQHGWQNNVNLPANIVTITAETNMTQRNVWNGLLLENVKLILIG